MVVPLNSRLESNKEEEKHRHGGEILGEVAFVRTPHQHLAAADQRQDLFHSDDVISQPGADRRFLESTPIQMPPESGGICGRLT